VIKQASARAKLVVMLRKAGARTLSEIRGESGSTQETPSCSPYLGMELGRPMVGGECYDCVGRVWRPSDRDYESPPQSQKQAIIMGRPLSGNEAPPLSPPSVGSPTLCGPRDQSSLTPEGGLQRHATAKPEPNTILATAQGLSLIKSEQPEAGKLPKERPFKPKRTCRISERVRESPSASFSCGFSTRPFRPSDRDYEASTTAAPTATSEGMTSPNSKVARPRCTAFVFGSGRSVAGAAVRLRSRLTRQFGFTSMTTLQDEQVTCQRVVTELHRLAAASTNRDRVVVYFTGNCDQEGLSVHDGRLSYSGLANLLKGFPTPNVCLVVDRS